MKTKTIPNIPKVAMLSLWKDDTGRKLEERIDHLLAKSYANLRFVWVVGDSSDGTEDVLRAVAALDKRVTVIRHDTHIEVSDPDTRLLRMSQTANAGLQTVRKTDKYVVIHESDLITPVDVVEQFLATGKDVIGGSVWLGDIFYDTFCYRKHGQLFSNSLPYHPEYVHDAINEDMDCIGSCWMFPAAAIHKGLTCPRHGAVELCKGLKAMGYNICFDPRIRIIQPTDLFTSRSHANA